MRIWKTWGVNISVDNLAQHYVCDTKTAGERIERPIPGEFGMAAQPMHTSHYAQWPYTFTEFSILFSIILKHTPNSLQ